MPDNAPRSTYYIGKAEDGNYVPMSNYDRKLTPEQEKTDAFQYARCELLKKQVLSERNSLPSFVLRAMAREGCEVDAETFVKCAPCEKGAPFAAMVHVDGKTEQLSLFMCQNANAGKYKSDMERSMTHELIHVYDYCRAHVDFTNCRHHACTEIRAANLSRDCLWSNEWRRGLGKFITNQHNKCVKRRAWESIRTSPYCQGVKAKEAIDDVFERCIQDTEPFGAVPW